MGSSAKRKKEKKKDFQKPKLKVGKAKPKAANYTDTSFKAKSISLQKQSIAASAPSATAQISHHTSLLRNRTASQRHDSLAYLTNLPVQELADAAAEVLPKLPPLIHDESSSVRQQLLKLLKRFPESRVLAQTEQILLWTRAGITHLSTDIQLFSLDVLEWLLAVARDELFTTAGAWTGLINAFTTICGWQTSAEIAAKGWSQQKQAVRPGSESRIFAKRLSAVTALLKAGLAPVQQIGEPVVVSPFACYGLPRRPNAFAHLDLFGTRSNGEQQIFDNREDRQRIFRDQYEDSIRQGVGQALKEGGELGRASSGLLKQLDAGMADYDA